MMVLSIFAFSNNVLNRLIPHSYRSLTPYQMKKIGLPQSNLKEFTDYEFKVVQIIKFVQDWLDLLIEWCLHSFKQYFTWVDKKTIWEKVKMLVTSIFSSPEHKVLMVSFCDRPMSVVRHPQFL